uniref:G-protein coupled receptors family 1 profile domain-containing protein n=1 Tax=Wuchereria bancrofti TaxID=6293 RepID=A0AAF5PZJ6_WUCBA
MLARLHCIIVLFLILPCNCQKINVTDVFDIRDENHKTAKFVAFVLFTIFIFYGISINTLMVIVLFCKGKYNHYSREFVFIALQLIISNFMIFLPQMVVVLPEILTAKNSSYVNETIRLNRAFSAFDTFSFFSILHFSFLLTVNRFVVLILPKYCSFFESKKLYFLIAFMWLSAFVPTFFDFHLCFRIFIVSNLKWDPDCEGTDESMVWWRIRNFWALSIPNVMFLMQIAIFYNIRRKTHFKINDNQDQGVTHSKHEKNAAKIHHYEWSMLVQAAWHCGVLEIEIIVFIFLLPIVCSIFGDEADIPTRIFINCFIIFSCAILPTIHFIYSRQSRNIIKYHLYGWLRLRIGLLKNKVTIQHIETNDVAM